MRILKIAQQDWDSIFNKKLSLNDFANYLSQYTPYSGSSILVSFLRAKSKHYIPGLRDIHNSQELSVQEKIRQGVKVLRERKKHDYSMHRQRESKIGFMRELSNRTGISIKTLHPYFYKPKHREFFDSLFAKNIPHDKKLDEAVWYLMTNRIGKNKPGPSSNPHDWYETYQEENNPQWSNMLEEIDST